MCRLLETIKVKNGALQNTFYHNLRMHASRTELFKTHDRIELANEVVVPEAFRKGSYRCRIIYGRNIEHIEFLPLISRSFNRLRIVHHQSIDYHLKFADRAELDLLYSQRGDADEVIIVRNGLVTDCTIGNLVFCDGDRWLTPATPLLKGTQRQALLDRNLITATEIAEKDLFRFGQMGIINAFFDLTHMPIIKTTDIL